MNAPDIVDKDVLILAGLSGALKADNHTEHGDPWHDSPFEWIQRLTIKEKGAVGESLVAGWAAARGFDVVSSSSTGADRIIYGHRVEIKYANLGKGGGFVFNQVRNQEYDYCLFIGLSPFDAQAWLIPKDVAWENARPQHGGSVGHDTRMVNVSAARPPVWMAPYGERLSDVYQLLSDTGRGPH